MDEIRQRIFLGNSTDSKRVCAGKEEGRWVVFNLAQDLLIEQRSSNVAYVHVGLIDGPADQDSQVREAVRRLKQEIEHIRFYADENDEATRKLLVHCHQGRSRSPTILALALGELEGKDYDTMLAEIKERRGIVAPEPALVELGRKHGQNK